MWRSLVFSLFASGLCAAAIAQAAQSGPKETQRPQFQYTQTSFDEFSSDRMYRHANEENFASLQPSRYLNGVPDDAEVMLVKDAGRPDTAEKTAKPYRRAPGRPGSRRR